VDDAVADTLERLQLTVETQLRALGEAITGDDPPVAATVVDGVARDMRRRLERFERRVLAGVKRRETQAMQEVAALRAAIRPLGQSPERVLNLLPFLARYGTGVLTAMCDAAAPHAEALVRGPTVESSIRS
jgi:bacillithiol synthase